jgi:hypothetical protein
LPSTVINQEAVVSPIIGTEGFLIDTVIAGAQNLPADKVNEWWQQAVSDPAYAPIHDLDESQRKQLIAYLCIFDTFLKGCREIGGMSSERSQEIKNVITGSLFGLPNIPLWLERSFQMINAVLKASDEEINKDRDIQETMRRYKMPELFPFSLLDSLLGKSN